MFGNPYYYGTTFQPYQMQQNPQMIQPVNQPAQSVPNPDERIWVQGEDAAKAYLVAPNSFVRLWDSNCNVFYEKSADQSGRPYMQTFEYSPRNAVPQNTAVSDAGGTIDYGKEIEALKRRIQALEQMGEQKDE